MSRESTFRELATEAVHLLRGRLACRRATRVPGRRRRDLIRQQLQCIALLAVTAVLSLTTAWAVWNTAADHQLRLGGPGQPGTGALAVSLEDTFTTHRLETATVRGRDGYSPRAREGQPGTVRDAHGSSARSAGREDGALEVNGPVLGGAAAGTTLTVGLLAGRLVLRRFRTDVVVPPGADAEGEQAPVDPCLEPVLSDAGDPEEDPRDDRPAREHERPAQAFAHGEGPRGGDDLVRDTAPALSTQQEPEDTFGPPTPPPPVPAQESGSEPVTYVVRQRLYEARKAPRVPVQLEGQLRWFGEAWTVTVTALSPEDLTFQASTRPSVRGRQALLTGGDHVRIVFPGVTGLPVETSGQLAWQRAGAGGFAAGVRFVSLSTPDRDRVLAVCAAQVASES